jgi:hypothetical protein
MTEDTPMGKRDQKKKVGGVWVKNCPIGLVGVSESETSQTSGGPEENNVEYTITQNAWTSRSRRRGTKYINLLYCC